MKPKQQLTGHERVGDNLTIVSKELILRHGMEIWLVVLNGNEYMFLTEQMANTFIAKNLFK